MLLDQTLSSGSHGPPDQLLPLVQTQRAVLETWHPELLDPVPAHTRSFRTGQELVTKPFLLRQAFMHPGGPGQFSSGQ